MDIVNISIIFYIFWTTLCLSSWEKRKEWLSLIHITTVQTDQLDETPKGFVKFNNFLIIILFLFRSIIIVSLSMSLICQSIHAIDLSVYPCHWFVCLSMPLICQFIHAIDLSVYPTLVALWDLTNFWSCFHYTNNWFIELYMVV